MKRFIIISFVFMCGLAYGQESRNAEAAVSLDMASLISRNAIAIRFCHGFQGKWSVDGGFFIPYKNEPDSCPEFSLGMRFWPVRHLDGTYLGLGCVYNIMSGACMTAGCGYGIKIWRCFGITIGYEFTINERCIIPSEGIIVELNIRF